MRESRRPAGVAAAACVGCCAAPVIAWVAAAGLTGGLRFGLFGLVLAVVVGAAVAAARRRRPRSAATELVPVELRAKAP